MNVPFVPALAPESFHIASDDFEFAEDYSAPGVSMKLLQADIENAFFTVRIRFAPGVLLPPHKHTGYVHAFTLSGEWNYLEYAAKSPPNRAGSYLFEPAGSIHTLKVADHAMETTDVVFVIYGAMLILDDRGAVVFVNDAEAMLRDWPAAMREQGKQVPETLIVGGNTRYAGLG